MKIVFTIPLFCFLFSFSYGQKSDSTAALRGFVKKMEQCGLVFIQPEKFKETEVKENMDQPYDYAIKNKGLKIEIRYFIRPYDSLTIKLSEGTSQIAYSIFWTTEMNLTQGKRQDFIEYPPEAVKSEFGADWGATAAVDLKSEFGEGYKVCILTTIHKTNTADAFVFYLGNDIKTLQKKMNELGNNWFYTLTFRKF